MRVRAPPAHIDPMSSLGNDYGVFGYVVLTAFMAALVLMGPILLFNCLRDLTRIAQGRRIDAKGGTIDLDVTIVGILIGSACTALAAWIVWNLT